MKSLTSMVTLIAMATNMRRLMPVDRVVDPAATHVATPSGVAALSSCHRGGRSRATAQSGVGLIEVMVAVLVLSIGFLGIAALEAMSLSTNNSAMARSMATISSYSILDAMRADIGQAEAFAYNKTVTADSCPTATTTLADNQLGQWCNQLAATLGATSNTKGVISCSASGECTVTISFDDSRAGAGGANNQTVVTKGIL